MLYVPYRLPSGLGSGTSLDELLGRFPSGGGGGGGFPGRGSHRAYDSAPLLSQSGYGGGGGESDLEDKFMAKANVHFNHTIASVAVLPFQTRPTARPGAGQGSKVGPCRRTAPASFAAPEPVSIRWQVTASCMFCLGAAWGCLQLSEHHRRRGCRRRTLFCGPGRQRG